jgi:CYTH domain-containing protein
MAKEIERKFLLNGPIPWNIKMKEILIKQGYVFATKDTQFRVRLINKKSLMCLKYTKNNIRDEYEYKIPFSDGKEIYNKCEMKVEKKRSTIKPYKAPYIIDIDTYPNGLIVAEVEFKSVKESENFVPFNWFGKEITGQKSYSNITLAKQKLHF